MRIQLRDLSLTLRCLITLTLLVLAAGYGVAIVNLYYTYSLMDGEPGLTAEDLKRAFYGRRTVTLLAAKIDGGSMEQFLPDPVDKAKILKWIQDGATREGFEKVVAPILARNCWQCHNPDGFMYRRPLQTYEQVQDVTKVDRGEPPPIWARVAHTHLQSIGLIFFVVGLIFAGTAFSERVKTVVVTIPFVSLVVDFGSRFLARYHPGLVYVMMAAGALSAFSFAAMVVCSLHELWRRRGQDSLGQKEESVRA
ncbi:MAG: hypothetical protein K6T59_04050 [Bryobacteraceae bacterium]|jgi:hypothetical protein|nr:hypothetical protein [Bryobacteraceae bacterium]